MGQFLLDTSGTVSYVFVQPADLPAVTPENVFFKDNINANPVEVYFSPVTLQFRRWDDNSTTWDVTFDLGFIDATIYQNNNYFFFPKQGSLGLCPTSFDATYISRQFLYQATVSKGMEESYIMMGANFTFAIGMTFGEITDYGNTKNLGFVQVNPALGAI